MSKNKSDGGVFEYVRIIVYAGLVAIGIRTVAFEPFNIPSGSMIPTLLVGDYLFVSKFSYGYSRFSLPFSLPLFDGRVFESHPERGDVAVFRLPSDDSIDYIKRIIGLPGDTIQVKGGILYLNGEPVHRNRVQDYVVRNNTGYVQRYAQYVETLPGGRTHKIIETSDNGNLDNTDVYHVPPGHYFAMGDNRDNSLDSRVLNHVGFIPAENFIGRAEFIWFSTDGTARIWEFWKWPFATRFARFLQGIE
ncbi:MAG: signal peptidase I [Rhodospirillales bacterium]|nr:signal peptidase I [Rhodospirillales bacterium]MCW8862453.1 signal peptidase I [Rhodospirillales bacterium]MCW8952522.1 signal peptidase I [Rhodospirillales bacterium]MCW8970149.1 signal peptidase I [Rhodospirillales bacterium]MCW9003000.1 signal peptidase I [Rhodospirillales bacterium]